MTTRQPAGSAQSAAVYSNAFNFLSFVQTGVDPRTGLYTVSLSLPPVMANALAGPALSASLAFNPMQTDDRGFGVGWAVRLSSYDAVAKLLRLSSGETYRAHDTGPKLIIEDQKLRTFRVDKVGSEFVITYKSGVTEVLSLGSGGDGVYLPAEIRSQEGHTLRLRYATFRGRRMLSEVHDDARMLMSIERAAGLVSIVIWPGTPQAATLSLWLVNDRVTELRLPVENRAAWRFAYETIGELAVISRVDTPLGGFELVRHQAQGHAFPAGAPQRHLPYVIEHVKGPRGGQPPLRCVYRYSSRNFLGNGASGLKWVDGEDNLCKVLEDYRYESVESWMDGEGDTERVLRTVTRTYNRFHLLVSEETSERGHVHRKETTYHVLDGRPYADQPPQCQLPSRVVTSWRVGADTEHRREDIVETSFDDYGNLLRQIDAAGVTEQYVYYDAAGGDGCPADPLGFVRFVAQKRVLPASIRDASAQAAAMTTRYRYAAIASLLPYSPAAVLCTDESLFEGEPNRERLLSETATAYFDTPSAPLLHARERTKTVTLDALATRTTYTYALRTAALEIVETTTGFDGTSRTARTMRSLVDGQHLEIEHDSGPIVRYRYDALGRVSTETTAPETPYEAARHYHYTLASTADDPVCVSATDAAGLTTRTWYDGLQRKTRIETQADGAAGEPYRLTYEARYDTLGRCVEEVSCDWLDGRPLALTSRHDYDAWGERSATLRADGAVEHRVIAPLERTTSAWLDDAHGHASGRSVTRYNAFDKPASIERYDRQGALYSTHVSEYDGFGRLVGETDGGGNTTRCAYDAFGRMTRRTLPDSTTVEYGYARYSADDLPIDVSIRSPSGTTICMGQQAFDGLGRRASRTVGGRRRTFVYEGGSDRPLIEQTPSGVLIRYAYEPRLTDKPIRRSAGEREEYYAYDPRHAQIVSMGSEGAGERCFEYSPLGHLLREQWREGERQYATSYVVSMLGRTLRYADRFGREQHNDYDSAGRLASIAQDTLVCRITYDGLGRLERTVTQDTQSNHTVAMTCAYDDFNREVERTFTIDGAVHTVTTQAYTRNDKLARRTVQAHGTTLRDEAYAYDARGRLVDYRYEGSHPMRDPFDNAICAQRYAYDECDNLVTLTTEFAGGQDVARYRYDNAADPTQATEVTHTHADYPTHQVFVYDADGNLVDTSSRVFRYDALGRLIEAGQTQSAAHGRYCYDPCDTLVACEYEDGTVSHRTYRDAQLVSERVASDTPGGEGEIERGYLRDGELLLAQCGGDASDGTVLYGCDAVQSVRLALASASRAPIDIGYAPYGARTPDTGLAGLLGLHGQPYDARAGGYLLGNGKRLYDPVLMRFLSPDPMSPFDGGGINGYAYCLGDPINRVDPTGYLSWQSILGIVVGAVAIAVAVASLGSGVAISAGLAQASAGLAAFATVPSATLSGVLAVGAVVADIASGATAIASSALSERDPQTAGILGWVSTGFGLAATAHGVSGAISGATRAGQGTASAAVGRFGVARSTLAVAASAQSVSTQIAAAFGKEPPAWASYALGGLSLALAGAGWGSALSETAFAARNGRMFDINATELAELGARAPRPAGAQAAAGGGPGATRTGTEAARANLAVRRVGAPTPDEQGPTRL